MDFVPQKTSSPELDQVQRSLRDVFTSWMLDRFLDLANPKEQVVATTDTRIYHGLGRKFRGRIIVYQSADARVWDVASADPASYLALRASATVTVKVLVY